MNNASRNLAAYLSRFKITRRGRKLQTFDDLRVVTALPKDISERIWVEILGKEETDMVVFEVREEIVEMALNEVYERYMEKQVVLFHAYCAMEAWLKIIDWNFYRHDPGEEPTAYPPCYIPKRDESWIPDQIPEPSPRDAMAIQQLEVLEDCSDEVLRPVQSSDSIEMPYVEEIPKEYWFPGRVELFVEEPDEKVQRTINYGESESVPSSENNLVAESELLQKVTDYGLEDHDYEQLADLKGSVEEGFMHGAGDSAIRSHRKRLISRFSITSRSKSTIQKFDDSWSKLSTLSDCKVRNPRLDTHYEIASERLNTPLSEQGRGRKK